MVIMKDAVLVKEQMKIISDLQEKIRLLEFEIVQLNREKTILKQRLKSREKTIKKIKIELMDMKAAGDFSKINNIIYMLRAGVEKND